MQFRFVKIPHESRWNIKPVPCYGGIGIVLPVLFYLLSIGEWQIAVGGFSLFSVGLMDDIAGLRADFRFLFHIAVSIYISKYLLNLYVQPSYFEIGVSVLFIVVLINAFNFIDNMDGIAGITTLIISLYLFQQGNFSAGILFCSLFVFLWGYNIPKARLWMGDCGSTVLGFLLAVFYLKDAGGKPDINALSLFSFPLLDITYITIRRIIERKKPWMGDTNHISHLLSRAFGDKGAFFIVAMYMILVWFVLVFQ